MNIEVKMMIKQLESTTKENMINELKKSECVDEEIQALVNETINIIRNSSEKELIAIKTELLSVN